MSDLVHYLIRHPTEKGGLIYPTELDDPAYVGFGSFYMLGRVGSRIGEAYTFHAVFGEELVATNLLPFRNSRSFFRAEVQGVGTFLFYAQPIAKKPTYVGVAAQASTLVALRRLRSWQPFELDRACRENDFYFVGYSPRLANLA